MSENDHFSCIDFNFSGDLDWRRAWSHVNYDTGGEYCNFVFFNYADVCRFSCTAPDIGGRCSRLQEKNISLDVFCEPKELVKKFDQDLMISVVTNLIDNAVKASRKESKIVLEATPDHLMVQDFGKGIPKEDLEMVTEPFYMVDKSRSRAKGSVGLGLSLCQKIIELHDFQLKIESNPGKGTTVSVFW